VPEFEVGYLCNGHKMYLNYPYMCSKHLKMHKYFASDAGD
jgi:hypothetical protein